jgi:hypothetical protein
VYSGGQPAVQYHHHQQQQQQQQQQPPPQVYYQQPQPQQQPLFQQHEVVPPPPILSTLVGTQYLNQATTQPKEERGVLHQQQYQPEMLMQQWQPSKAQQGLWVGAGGPASRQS